jgi:5-methylcytosine-specific restriction endonuclease McrA
MKTFELNGKFYPWYRRMSVHQWREVRQFVYERDGGKCRYCDSLTRYDECHIHHVLPLSEGGTNHPTNLKTSCVECHKIKHPHMRTARDKAKSLPFPWKR